MTYLSLIEKMKILFTTIFDFKAVLIVSALMLLLTILFLVKKLSVKRYTISLTLSLILVFLISIFGNIKVLSNTFENFTTVFFTGIYFPSIYLYLSTNVIVFISFAISIISAKMRKVYKIINRIMFVLNSILFALILNIVAKNKTDIFSVNSLYTNTTLVVMLEISMGLFLLWLAALFIAYMTNALCDRIAKKREIKVSNEVVNTTEVVEPVSYSLDNNYILVDTMNRKFDDIKIIESPSKSKKVASYISSYIPKTVKLVHNLAPYGFEEEVVEKEKVVPESIVDFINKEKIVPDVRTKKEGLTFEDILNCRVPVSYYEYNKEEKSYSIINPQEVYESHYNTIKAEELNNTIDVIDNSSKQESLVKEEEKVNNVIVENTAPVESIVENTSVVENNTIVEENNIEEIKKEDSINESVSLNDFVDNDVLEDVKVIDKVEEITKSSYTDYTIEDYKKIITMLNSLKKQGIDHNVTIDDAVAISLISNYSIDDCLKFKDILESTLN